MVGEDEAGRAVSGAILSDSQMELRNLVIGKGTPYCWVDEVPDWWGYSSVRTNDTPLQSTSGVRGGRDLLGAKTLTGQVIAQDVTRTGLLSLIDAFMLNFDVTDDNVALRANLLGATRRRYGRPRRAEPAPRLTTRFSRVSKFASIITFQFDALDPTIYGDALQSTVIALPSAGVGFTVPFTVPFTVTGGGSSGIGGAANGGTIPAPWSGRIDGPIVNPTIRHQDQDLRLDFDGGDGLTLGPTDFVLLDSATESVLLNGETDRRSTLDLGSFWFDLNPGANNIGFTADSGSGFFTITWRDAFR